MLVLGAPRYDRRWIMKLAHEKRRTAREAKPLGMCLEQAWGQAKAIAAIAEMRRPGGRKELFAVHFREVFRALAGEPQPRERIEGAEKARAPSNLYRRRGTVTSKEKTPFPSSEEDT